MLGRINSQSNPLNVQKKLITEPSLYLQQLQQLLADKQKHYQKEKKYYLRY